MTRVKICGITNLEDAVASVDAGADMLGFNFCEKSPRFIEKNIAAEIINHIPERVECVGVFVNYGPPEDVMEVCSQLGLAAAQLHGDETAEYCKAITGYPVIKAFRAGPGFNSADIVPFDVDAIMLDAFHPFQRGGTGHSVDWSLASRVR